MGGVVAVDEDEEALGCDDDEDDGCGDVDVEDDEPDASPAFTDLSSLLILLLLSAILSSSCVLTVVTLTSTIRRGRRLCVGKLVETRAG
jgi:hypothetical protein